MPCSPLHCHQNLRIVLEYKETVDFQTLTHSKRNVVFPSYFKTDRFHPPCEKHASCWLWTHQEASWIISLWQVNLLFDFHPVSEFVPFVNILLNYFALCLSSLYELTLTACFYFILCCVPSSRLHKPCLRPWLLLHPSVPDHLGCCVILFRWSCFIFNFELI